jgi:hypothetical protein
MAATLLVSDGVNESRYWFSNACAVAIVGLVPV